MDRLFGTLEDKIGQWKQSKKALSAKGVLGLVSRHQREVHKLEHDDLVVVRLVVAHDLASVLFTHVH
jgi:hypothetical protein